ncbi:MAG: NfeD family protein [Gammaproteobacteria bacterium]|jgi:membrane protein implicated in regulation of membrane protease activity
MVDIFAMTHWSWLVLGLGLLVLELVVPAMFFLWLGISALVTGLVLYLSPDMSWQGQFLLFSVLSVVSILLSRRFFSNKQIETELPNLNRRGQQYVGRVFTLIEPIKNGYGKISVDDSQWRVTGPALEKGVQVKVVSAKGSVFEVEPVES